MLEDSYVGVYDLERVSFFFKAITGDVEPNGKELMFHNVLYNALNCTKVKPMLVQLFIFNFSFTISFVLLKSHYFAIDNVI